MPPLPFSPRTEPLGQGAALLSLSEPLAEGCVSSASSGPGTCCGGLVAQSCLSLCDPTDCSPPGSSLHWRLLEGVTICFSKGSS